MEEKDNPNYYAIIPAIVRYDKSISSSEKLIYGEISSLTNKEGFCWASNQYFAELYDVTKTAVSGWISNLERQGHIKTEIIDKNTRKIWINHEILGIQKKLMGDTKKVDGGYKKICRGDTKKVVHNSKSNNKENNKDILSADKSADTRRADQHIIDVIEKFNLVSPTAATKYGAATWRKAADELVKFCGGLEQALSFIDEFVQARKSNMLYLPVVDSLVTMSSRYASIRQVLDKEKAKGGGYNPKGNSGYKYAEPIVDKLPDKK